jgi:hypothetical protein
MTARCSNLKLISISPLSGDGRAASIYIVSITGIILYKKMP